MKKIKLTNCDAFVLVDDEDFEKANSKTWALTPHGYPRRNESIGKINGKWRQRKLYLHRFLMGEPVGLDIDHINHDKLDCRRHNLRIVPRDLNLLNRIVPKGHPTGVHGVRKDGNRWVATMSVGDKGVWLGSFLTKEEAVTVRKQAEQKRYASYLA